MYPYGLHRGELEMHGYKQHPNPVFQAWYDLDREISCPVLVSGRYLPETPPSSINCLEIVLVFTVMRN